MAAADKHTFQVLTKRPDRMLEWFSWYDAAARDRELLGCDPTSGIYDMPADLGFLNALIAAAEERVATLNAFYDEFR